MEHVFLIVLVEHLIMVINVKNVQLIVRLVQVQYHVLFVNQVLFRVMINVYHNVKRDNLTLVKYAQTVIY
jgi:hypothetical protein